MDPGTKCFPSGQLSIEFLDVGDWLTCGDLALNSCGYSHPGFGPLVICCVRLVISRFGPLPVRIRLLVVMLGLGLSA